MDIAELILETERLKQKSLETAKQLAEAKELLYRVLIQMQFFNSPGAKIIKTQINEFLK